MKKNTLIIVGILAVIGGYVCNSRRKKNMATNSSSVQMVTPTTKPMLKPMLITEEITTGELGDNDII